MRNLSVGILLFFCAAGCGGGSGVTPVAPVSGAYEFAVTSTVTGGTTLVEANLVANGAQSSASGPTQVQVVTHENKTWYINGVCAGVTPGQNSVAANQTGSGNVALTFNEGGNQFSGQGTIVGAAISANYSVNGSSCPDLVGLIGYPAGYDAGGIVGSPVPNLAGTFVGVLNLPDGADNASLTLTEDSHHNLTVQAILTGSADNGSFIFSGSAVGNVMFVSGSVNGKTLSWFGLSDVTGRLTGTGNSLLIFDYDTLAQAGLLLKH